MLKLTRKIKHLGLLRSRALAPLLASAISAIAVVALLTSGGHQGLAAVGAGAHRELGAGHMRGRLEPGQPSGPVRGPAALGSGVDAALRTALICVRAPAATAAVVWCAAVRLASSIYAPNVWQTTGSCHYLNSARPRAS